MKIYGRLDFLPREPARIVAAWMSPGVIYRSLWCLAHSEVLGQGLTNMKKMCTVLIFFIIHLSAFSSVFAAGPRRIVCLIPSHSEILEALGAADLMVGVSDEERSDYRPSVPRVGGLKPNWEALIGAAPELILADVCHERYAKEFHRFRLPVLFLSATRATTIEDVFHLIRQIAELVDQPEKAENMIRNFEARIRSIEARLPSGEGPKVYFEIWPRPLQACGPKSLQGHLLRRAKAINIVPDSRNTMPLISLEWVPKKGPDVLLHTGIVTDEEIMARPGWDRVLAVQKGRVHGVDQDRFSRAGPRIVDAFEELVNILYGVQP